MAAGAAAPLRRPGQQLAAASTAASEAEAELQPGLRPDVAQSTPSADSVISRIQGISLNAGGGDRPLGRGMSMRSRNSNGSPALGTAGGAGGAAGGAAGEARGAAGGAGGAAVGLAPAAVNQPGVIRPSRPPNRKQGRSGKEVQLRANYFRLLTRPQWTLNQYRVDVSPEPTNPSVPRHLIRNLKEALGLSKYVFTGTVLFTETLIAKSQREVIATRDDDDIQYRVTFRLVGNLTDLSNDYIQVFNSLMRRCLRALRLELVGREYYDREAEISIPARRMKLWPGYQTSIRMHESEVLMCAEITHKVLRTDTVHDSLRETIRKHGAEYREYFLREVLGCIVLTTYNNKTYRVDDVDFNLTPNNVFSYRGEDISYAAYMNMKYGKQVRDLNQPMLISRAKARDVRAGGPAYFALIPEMCQMTGISDSTRECRTLMQELAAHIRVSPSSRIAKLRDFNRRLHSSEECQAELRDWNMRLDTDLVELRGRILDEVNIIYGGDKQCVAGKQANWTTSLRNNKQISGVELRDWVVLVPASKHRDAMGFVGSLKQAARGMGMTFNEPEYNTITKDSPQNLAEALRSILDRRAPQLILCVLMSKDGGKYSLIKKKCCLDRAVPTQVMQATNLSHRSVMSIATKVAIQINCKLGGSPWTVDLPPISLMVVGFDVCHDTSNRRVSYGATVASLNSKCTRYFSIVNPHSDSRTELSEHLASNVLKAVQKYKDFNQGCLPKFIIIYRDGVGEGQVEQVRSLEVNAIKENLAREYGGMDQVKMAFIIVTKRINTRVFLGSENPSPGTIVDDVITDPMKYDFYLVSQTVREGTVTPTYYHIIDDTTGTSIDHIQKLTFKMCHLYYNWSGTIRVPAPCQYAHKLAFLAGQSLHSAPRPELDQLLYFL